jgi:hypothetical protein
MTHQQFGLCTVSTAKLRATLWIFLHTVTKINIINQSVDGFDSVMRRAR